MSKTKIISHQVEPDKLTIEWGDGHTSRYHYMWLRDNAPENRHANGQKLIDTLSIPLDLTAKSVSVNGNVQIEWANDGHVTEFSAKWLRDNSYEKRDINGRRAQKNLWETADFPELPPFFSYPQLTSDEHHLRGMLTSVRDY